MNPQEDGRRYRAQRLESLSYEASVLQTLLLAIRTGTDAHVRELVNCIRRGETHPEILSLAKSILAATAKDDIAASRISIASLVQDEHSMS